MDFTHNDQTFVAADGTLKIVSSIRNVNAGGGFFSTVNFELNNVTMTRSWQRRWNRFLHREWHWAVHDDQGSSRVKLKES